MRVTDEMIERAQLAADELNVMVPANAMRAALSSALAADRAKQDGSPTLSTDTLNGGKNV